MSLDATLSYLSKLLNRPIAADSAIRLSSAQRARFGAWASAQSLSVDVSRVTGEFAPSMLFASRDGASQTSTESGPSRMSVQQNDPNMRSLPMRIGIDIQSISELAAGINVSDLKADPELLSLFTLRELSYAQGRQNPEETLAGLFAAKEAIRKCSDAAMLPSEAFRSLEILPDRQGRPTASGHEISLSHSGNFAIAVACRRIEERPPTISASTSPILPAPVKAIFDRWQAACLAAVLSLICLHLWLILRHGL